MYSQDTNTFHIPDYQKFGYVDLARSINAIDAAIIYLADLFKSAKVYAVDKNGKIVESDPLVKRLQEPNHLQGLEEFLAEFYYYLTAAGWTYLLPYNTSVGFEKDLENGEIFALNPDFCKFGKIKENIFDLQYLDFNYSVDSGDRKLEKDLSTADVIPFWDGPVNVGNPFIGHSRLSSLREEAINTILADRGKHNQIKKTGSMIISHRERGNDGFSDGLDEMVRKTKDKKIITHKDEIETKLNMLGLAQGNNILVSSKELTGFSMGKDLIGIDFDKMKESDIIVINNKIGVPPELMPLNGNNAKYENRNMAQFQVLQNRIEPIAKNLAVALTKFYNTGNTLVFSYEHLPAYQYAKLEKEESKNKIVERVKMLKEMGVVTDAQAIQILTNHEIL